MILAYFVYGSLAGVLGMLLLYFIVSLVCILCLIPIVGWIISVSINWYIVIPIILAFTGLEYTWLVSLIFAYSVIVGLIITSLMAIVIVGILLSR